MSNFSWSKTDWGETFKINLLRSIGAGIVLTILIIIFGLEKKDTSPFVFLLFPLVYFPFVFPLSLIFKWLSNLGGIGSIITTLISLVLAFSVALGDPLV